MPNHFGRPALAHGHAIPKYYNPFPEQSPTCPGWYLCWSGPQASYLSWKDNAFWNGEGPQADVTHWVELPEFVRRVLDVAPAPL